MKLPTKIKEVLEVLDQIIEETVLENNHLGVFAYVYRRTTAEIEKAILEGRFEDNPRMERMDVAFANLYIKAYYDYKAGKEVSRAWESSFAAGKMNISLVQHLMLGMNAHINLDLGQSAALIEQGENIQLLKNDFMEVNKVLAELTDVMQKKLGRVSRLMFVLDVVGQRSDEKLVNFSMVKARNQAWKLAEELAYLNGDSKEERLYIADENVSFLSSILIDPPLITLKIATKILSLFEEKNVKKVIDEMSTP